MVFKDLNKMVRDSFCYLVQPAYLKFPQAFKKRFGIGTHIKLDESFPNPEVGYTEFQKTDKVQIVYEFNISELEEWKAKKELERKREKDDRK